MSQLKILNARLAGKSDTLHNILIEDGVFVQIDVSDAVNLAAHGDMADVIDVNGKLILPGFIETHLHLDKACILHRCCLTDGTLAEAIEQTASAKARFTQADIYQRAEHVLQKAILQGTTLIRTHVEIDPVIGLQGFYAIRDLQQAYRWAVDIEICVFPQEGMLNNPGTEALLIKALDEGADVLGGCPYTDSHPHAQIDRLFEIAVERNLDLDFHLDFDLKPEQANLPYLCQKTQEYQWQGRVTAGHVTKLSMLPPAELNAMAELLAVSGVNITVLPSTDLFLGGRDYQYAVPRGVAPLKRLAEKGVICSVSTNNVANPFTPYGDLSLVRQANLYANIASLGTDSELNLCLGWISEQSARLLRRADYGISPGCKADFLVFDALTSQQILAEIQSPIMGFKHGRQTFERQPGHLISP